MPAIEGSKHFALISAIILVFGLLFVIYKWPQGKNRTFSQHVAATRHGIVYYALLFSLVLPLLLLFFLKWFVPTFKLSGWFTFFIIAAVVTQYLCTLIPETGGRRTKIHRLLAFVSADCLFPAVLLLVFSSTVSTVGRFISFGAAVIMATIIVIMVTNNAEHKYLLFLQSLYFVVFFVSILSITYIH